MVRSSYIYVLMYDCKKDIFVYLVLEMYCVLFCSVVYKPFNTCNLIYLKYGRGFAVNAVR